MIVCICRGKSDRDVAAAIDDGACSVRDLQRCGIGTDCGSCHNVLRMMFAEAAATAAVPCACAAAQQSSQLAAVSSQP